MACRPCLPAGRILRDLEDASASPQMASATLAGTFTAKPATSVTPRLEVILVQTAFRLISDIWAAGISSIRAVSRTPRPSSSARRTRSIFNGENGGLPRR